VWVAEVAADNEKAFADEFRRFASSSTASAGERPRFTLGFLLHPSSGLCALCGLGVYLNAETAESAENRGER
jgi:hypothetical protein